MTHPKVQIIIHISRLKHFSFSTILQIDKEYIQKFQLGGNPPACTIELEWTESGEQKFLLHKVNIIGAKKPDDYFYMRYYPQAVGECVCVCVCVCACVHCQEYIT